MCRTCATAPHLAGRHRRRGAGAQGAVRAQRAGAVAQRLRIHRRAGRLGARQSVVVHGWVYGLHNGLIDDLKMTVANPPTWPGPTAWLGAIKTRYDAIRKNGKPLNGSTRCSHPPHRFARLRHRQALLEGFNRHYRLFRETSAQAKRRFEQADWHGQQRAQRERIEFYDKRVDRRPSGCRPSSRPAAWRWTCGSRSSCTTSACSPTTTSPSSPRPSSTR